jgi:probable H4MPT-linked C1 transfer pathway protein
MGLSVLGLDIGGANLKAAHSSGVGRLQPFALWKQPNELDRAVRQLIALFPPWDVLAVTMTGELCDCYETRRHGVLAILDAVERCAAGRRTAVWLNTGCFVDLHGARKRALRAAAANWLALAHLAAKFVPLQPALLIDIGSTTTDIVPLRDGSPAPFARTDRRRLLTGELTYTGVKRTPLCAVLGPTAAAELFAAYMVLGSVAEDPADHGTADGRPATITNAYRRLAHMLCSDADSCPEAVLLNLARRARAAQIVILRQSIKRLMRLGAVPATLITAGSGEFLADAVLDGLPGIGGTRISLTKALGPDVSTAACAYAVAVLAAEQLPDAG